MLFWEVLGKIYISGISISLQFQSTAQFISSKKYNSCQIWQFLRINIQIKKVYYNNYIRITRKLENNVIKYTTYIYNRYICICNRTHHKSTLIAWYQITKRNSCIHIRNAESGFKNWWCHTAPHTRRILIYIYNIYRYSFFSYNFLRPFTIFLKFFFFIFFCTILYHTLKEKHCCNSKLKFFCCSYCSDFLFFFFLSHKKYAPINSK